jgi:hypothetical protein
MNPITDHMLHLLYQEADREVSREPGERADKYNARVEKYVARRAKEIAAKLIEIAK